MRKFVFIAAGGWAFVYSFFIWLTVSANFTPEFKSGVDIGITSSMRVIGILAVVTLIHLILQTLLALTRPAVLSTGEKWFDLISTVKPFLNFLIWSYVYWGMLPKVSWWTELSWWFFWIILLGLVADGLNLPAIWRNISGPAAPRAAH